MHARFDRGGFRVSGGQKNLAKLALARGRRAFLRDERQHGANRRVAASAKTDGSGENTRGHAQRTGKIYQRRSCRIAHARFDRFRGEAVKVLRARLMSANAGTKVHSISHLLFFSALSAQRSSVTLGSVVSGERARIGKFNHFSR